MLKTQKFWIAIFIVLLTVCVLCVFLFNRSGGEVVEIYHEDELICEMDLNVNQTKKFELDEGVNVVEVKDGSVYVKSADCKNQICVNSTPISSVGSVIVCAPHSFTIKIASQVSEDAYV